MTALIWGSIVLALLIIPIAVGIWLDRPTKDYQGWGPGVAPRKCDCDCQPRGAGDWGPR